LGLGEPEVKDFISKFIIENYLNDEGNFQPVKEVSLEPEKNVATVELSSVEETNKLVKVETIQILKNTCKVTRVAETAYGQSGNYLTLVNNA